MTPLLQLHCRLTLLLLLLLVMVMVWFCRTPPGLVDASPAGCHTKWGLVRCR
jgi:hypothetical protein